MTTPDYNKSPYKALPTKVKHTYVQTQCMVSFADDLLSYATEYQMTEETPLQRASCVGDDCLPAGNLIDSIMTYNKYLASWYSKELMTLNVPNL